MKPLRIGLVMYGLDRPLSGVTRFAQELGRAMRTLEGVEVTYLTTSHQPSKAVHTWRLPGCARLPALMLLGGPAIALAARQLRLDVVHDPTGVSPFTIGHWAGAFRRVTTIHDAIAFRYPEGYPWMNNLLHRHYVPATMPNVDAVATDSEHARRDVLRFVNTRGATVRVIPGAAGDYFRPVPRGAALAVARRLGLEAPYVLSVGAQQERKNVAGVLRAFAVFREHRPDYTLAIAGPTLWAGTPLARLIDELDLGSSVRQLGYVHEEDLASLYSGASMFVFPSFYEGFGLPPLEAMACGTPVVCSSATSLPEVMGDAALPVDPANMADMAAAMGQIADDAGLAADLSRRGLRQAQGFSWHATASQHVRLYEELVA